MMDWVKRIYGKYADFSGRARRKEYWFFFLFFLLVLIGLSILDTLLGTYSESRQVGLLAGLFWLGSLLPSIAVGVRRLHDIGRSGWWLLLAFLPLIGPVVLLVFAVLDSQPGDNAYGPNPKT